MKSSYKLAKAIMHVRTLGFKGTVLQDKLHESGTKGLDKDINRYIGFWFLNFDLEYLKSVLSSEPLRTEMPPTSCYFGTQFLQNPFFLLAAEHFYLMKKSVKVLHFFGLDCGMLEFFKYCTDEPSSKEQLLTLPHF